MSLVSVKGHRTPRFGLWAGVGVFAFAIGVLVPTRVTLGCPGGRSEAEPCPGEGIILSCSWGSITRVILLSLR